MIKNANLENILDELFKDSINGYSDEYLNTLNTIIGDDYKHHLTIQSVALQDNKLECIFIDRFNLKFVSKVYDLNHLLTQWNYLRYNVVKMKEVVQMVIDYSTMNTIFTFICQDTNLIILNAGVDHLIVVPSTDIYPLLKTIYGTLPPHTIIKPVTLTKEPNLKEDIARQPPGFITTDDQVDSPIKQKVFTEDLPIDPMYILDSVNLSLSLNKFCLTYVHATEVKAIHNVAIPISGAMDKLYEKYKRNNSTVSFIAKELLKDSNDYNLIKYNIIDMRVGDGHHTYVFIMYRERGVLKAITGIFHYHGTVNIQNFTLDKKVTKIVIG